MNKSPAFKAVDEFRDACNRGAVKIQAKDLSSTVYLFEYSGAPCAALYIGRSKNAHKRVRYATKAVRKESISAFMKRISEAQQARKGRTAAPRSLNVGDVLMASWGYDQTNIDYFLVTALIGKASVEIVEIGKERNEILWQQGKCIPDPTNIIGEPMRKRARGNAVRIDNVRTAFKKSRETLAGGVTVFNADFWSSYH